jgi:predicted kinase
MLIIVCGLPGTGKSTLARELANRLSAVHVSSDIIRKEMSARPGYGPEDKARVYDELVERISGLLLEGKSVIADATFYRRSLRGKLVEEAARAHTPVHFILCTLDEAEIRRRLIAPPDDRGRSDADFSVYLKVKESFEPLRARHLKLDCALPLERQVEMVLEFVEGVENRGA